MKNEEFPDVVSDFQVQCVGEFFGVSRSLAARDSVTKISDPPLKKQPNLESWNKARQNRKDT